MRSHSALARLQQVTTVSMLACATGWLFWRWPESPVVALLGFVAVAMSYSIFLALEFVAVHFVGRADPAPRATWSELARAWLAETVTAPRVFCWRQPFRWRAVPDQLEPAAPGRRGAVFIHGFVCNRGFWNPWLERMHDVGHPFVAVNLEPIFGSIEEYASIVEEAVAQITRATGLPPVLVCHSMGGLAARAWLAAAGAHSRVHHIVTIGSPHQGTWLGHFSRVKNGSQMRLNSDWLVELRRRGGDAHNAKFTCWYSNCDNVVFPPSTATLPGADNRLVRGAAHVDLGFHPEVMDETMARITA